MDGFGRGPDVCCRYKLVASEIHFFFHKTIENTGKGWQPMLFVLLSLATESFTLGLYPFLSVRRTFFRAGTHRE